MKSPGEWTFGLAVGLAAFLAALITATDYGIVSDVGNYFESSLLQLQWAEGALADLFSGNLSAAFDREALLSRWRWNPVRLPHPPLSRELGGLTYAGLGGLLNSLTAYRVAVMAVYGALVASVYVIGNRASGRRLGGLAAAATLLTVPAMFAYSHFALTDLFLAAFWFWSVAALETHLRTERKAWLWIAGLCLGAAMATKFTGLLVGAALILWLIIRRRLTPRRLAVVGAAALAVFVAVNPVMWVAPITGLNDYLAAGFGRAAHAGTQITTVYFGTLYEYRPPWHYPFVWTLIVVPIPWLAAAAIGVGAVRGAWVRWSALSAGIMYGALLLPSAPLHDGIRLFLPVFPFLAVVAGMGVSRSASWLERRLPGRWTSDFSAALVLLLFAGLPLVRTVQYHPTQLSYFNAFIGGVRGAERRGLEVTGLKEALTPQVLAELGEHIQAGDVVAAGFLTEEVCFYRGVGQAPEEWRVETNLPRDGVEHVLTCDPERRFASMLRPGAALEPAYVFVLNRPGQYTDLEWSLTEFGGSPFYQLEVQGVPLLEVYRTQ
ncbi:MAG: glycosyltransferase family 39 protein [Gemmatimonadota bacterium]